MDLGILRLTHKEGFSNRCIRLRVEQSVSGRPETPIRLISTSRTMTIRFLSRALIPVYLHSMMELLRQRLCQPERPPLPAKP